MFAGCTIDAGGVRHHEGEAGAVPWWSFTKLVLATAALKLVQQQLVELDSTLPGRAFTLRQLLQHEAGLPDYGGLENYHAAVAAGEEPWSSEEMIARTFDAHPPGPPGSRWAYSNIGYFMVGELICAATGKDLGTSLAELVIGPAGLREARLAVAKSDLEGVQMGSATGYDPGWVLHGLLVGPISEAVEFLYALLSGALLSRPMVADMLKVRLLPQFRDALWPHPAYGLGIMGAWDGPASPCGHSGEGPGSAIAVYGCARGDRAKVAARWASSGNSREVERAVLLTLVDL